MRTKIARTRRGLFAALFSSIFAAVALPTLSVADVTPAAGMLRYPAVSESKIAFVYANQIWTVSRSGGTASPVASPPAAAAWPRFSPDGKTLAFVANFDGNRDIYTVPLTGGIPTRVTHHPVNETLCGWTDDSTLLFFAGNNMTGMGPARIVRLYTVSATGGLPEKLPMPYAAFGAVSRDGEWVAFTPHTTDDRTWRRYRGGMATDIWLLNLKTGESRRATDWEGTDSLPMWGHNRGGKTLYYVSDAGPSHRLNIWSLDIDSGERTQITRFTDHDVRWPSIGPGAMDARGKGEIVFQLGSRLMLLDLDTRESRAISVTIPGARPNIKPRIEDASEFITGGDLSPSGKRVLLTARGDLWSLPAKEGATRNLSVTPGIFEREAEWSPDARSIAYISDADGEYDLWIRASDARAATEKSKNGGSKEEPGDGDEEAKDDGASDASGNEAKTPPTPLLSEPVRLTDLGPGFRSNITWSPDSKHITFTDNGGVLRLASLSYDDSGKPSATVKVIDTDPWSDSPGVAWSHDSNWIAYPRGDDVTGVSSLWIYEVATGDKRMVTAPMFNASSPTFDRKGDFLYYVSAREFSSPRYADNDTTFIYAGTQRLMMLPLRTDVALPSPLIARSDEEELGKGKDDKSDGAGAKPGRNGKPERKEGDDSKAAEADKPVDKAAKPDSKPLKIDFGQRPGEMESRAVILPLPAASYRALSVTDDGKLLYVRGGSRGEDERPSIRIFDPKDDAREEKTVAADVGGYSLSANGKKLLIRRGGGERARYQVLDATAGGGKASDVPTGAMRLRIDPRAEWKQIIADTYRLQRDFFYVPNMHGVAWDQVRDQGLSMLEDAASREDVSYIIAEMISQLNIGHAYLGAPGDVESGPSLNVGLLACDFELARGNGDDKPGAYRISRIYTGAPWDADARGPLAQAIPADKRPVEGDYLLAVNGVPLDTSESPWAALIGLADRPVTLTVSDQPAFGTSGANQREVLVTPVGSDTAIRFRAWIERNRAYVAERTDGKVGYIYVPNTGVDGQNELFRQFFGQRNLPGIIIDERWNGGGQIPTRFIELLNRPVTNYWAVRHGNDWTWPPDSHQGKLAMLINGQAGSGGDMFPWLFKRNNLGKVFGTRTWGGLVGISGNPGFIDGGSMTVPTFGFYKTDGTWGVEGHGVDPDVTVIDDPALMLDSVAAKAPMGVADPQLDAAIAHMKSEITDRPYVAPKRPEFPDRSGMGIPERDR